MSACLVLILVVGINLPSLAAQGDKKQKWVWSKQVPKPDWWKWGREYYPEKPVRGGTLQIAGRRYVGLMNPNHWPVNDWQVINLFYEGRFRFDGEYKQTNPWLAESWEFVSPKVVLVKFKEGIKFHDGTELNAKSIKYQFDWMNDPKNGCWTKGLLKKFKSLEVHDKYTVKWTTHKPWAAFPTGFFGFMISSEALKTDVMLRQAEKLKRQADRAKIKVKKAEKKAERAAREGQKKAKKALFKAKKAREKAEKLESEAALLAEKTKGKKNTDVHPVGTGAYMFDEALAGNYVKAKRNPNWWFGQSIGRPDMPYFDGIKVTVIPDPAIQLANLRAGKIDTMQIDKSQYAMMKRDPSVNIYSFPENSTAGLAFNHVKGPCQDIRVRKAVAHAIDRKALIYGTQFGLGRIASCVYPDDHWAHNPELKPMAYDPELSKRLLVEAGYAEGLTLKGHMGSDTGSQTLAVAVKQMLTKVGINWIYQSLEPAAINDKLRNLEYDLAGLYIPYIQDPHPSMERIYHPDGAFNYGRTNNEKSRRLIEAGEIEVDQQKRQQIYFQFEEVLFANYEDVWLFWQTVTIANRKVLQGFNRDMYVKGRSWYSASHPMWFKNGRR